MTKKINILTLVLSEKKFLNETKNHNPPLQVKLSVPNSYTHVQPHCIFFFFQCRTGVVADCFKFCGTWHARHTQLMSPRLCTTNHFTMTQLKLFTLIRLAWLTCCWRLALNSSMELAPTVVSGRWFHSRAVLWKEFLRVS